MANLPAIAPINTPPIANAALLHNDNSPRYSMFRSFPRTRESRTFFPLALDPRFRGDERD
jgi:hypothetical protein